MDRSNITSILEALALPPGQEPSEGYAETTQNYARKLMGTYSLGYSPPKTYTPKH